MNSNILEQQNNERIDELSSQVAHLKRLTIDIGNEVGEQNRFLDGMGDGFTNTRDLLAGSLMQIGTMLGGPEQAFQRANVDGTRHVLASARASGARRFVHISTPSVYFRFTDQLDVREDLPLGEPVNSYARTKRQAERLVLAETTLDPILLRPRGLYGAGDTALLPRLLKAAASRALPLLRDGAAVTDLTHVDDVVSAVEAALDLPPMPNAGPERRVFNISGGQPLPIREIVEAAAVRTGLSIRWRPLPVSLALGAARVSETICRLLPNRPEPPVTAYGIGIFAFSQTLDLSAARDTLGWSPRIDFQTGLERTFTPVSP